MKKLLLIINIFISSLFYSQVTSGLILHFDTKDINSYPGSGTVINDLSGNNRHSQIIGGVNYSNNQIVLDGTNNYIKTPGLPGISSNNQSFSFELIVTPSSTSGNVLSMSSNSNHGGWNMPPIGSANSKFFAEIYNNNHLVHPFNLGQKYHLVLVWDHVNNKQQFYVDGQLVDEQSNIYYNGSNGTNHIFLGEGNPGCCHTFEGVNSGDFAGNYELFRVYGTALSASEVLGNYNSATGCSITVDAGTDQTVCSGTAVTLTASVSSSGSTNTQTFTSANSNYSIDGEANVTGMTFNNDGTKMFLVGTQGNDITEYSLSTAYDVSTSIRSGEFAPSLGGLTGIAFNNNGTKVFLLSESTDKVHEYNLTTAFVVTSGVSFSQEKSVVAGDNCPTDLQFNNDGSKMYILGCRGDRVDEYDLSTPYDISTAGSSPSRTQNTNVSDSNPRAVVFSADGSKMFTIGLQNKSVREFSLSTPFNVTTSSSNGTHDLTSVDGQIRGMAFNGNGTKIYFAGQSNDKIYEYDLIVPYDLFGTNSFTYSWDNNVSDGVAFSPTSSATYTVTVTDVNGCTNTDAVDVTVNALPTVDAGVDVAICDGGSVTLTASGNSIITPSTLITFTNWGGNEPNNSGGEDYAHFANSSGTWNDHRSTHSTYHVMEAESDLGTVSGYTYLGTYGGHYYYKSNGTATWANSKITAENSGGYLAVFSDLNENNFVANLSGKAWIGLYQDNTDPTYSEPAGGWKWIETVSTGSYTWDNNVTNGTSFTPTSTTTYTVTATDANGCTNTDAVDVTVNALPTVDAGADQSVCSGDAVTLTATSSATINWDNETSLSFDGSSSTVNISSSSVTGSSSFICKFNFNSSNLPPDDSGDPNYTIIDQGTGGQWGIHYAEELNSIQFQVKSGSWYRVEAPITANNWYEIIAIYDQPNNQIFIYADGVLIDQNSTSGTLYNHAGAPGLRFCRFNNFAFTIDDFYLSSDVNELSSLISSTSNSITSNTLVAYDFSEGTGNTLNDLSSNNLDGTITSPIWISNGITDGTPFSPTNTATYTVIATDANGCISTDQVDVTVNALPTVDAGTDQVVCEGSQVTLSASGTSTYAWDNNVTNGTPFTPTSTTTYTVTATDANGCTNTDAVDVTVNALPAVDAGADQGICLGGNISLSALQNFNPIITNNLVGWWPFNGSINDESSNNNTTSLTGGNFSSDRNNINQNAYNFNQSSYIEIDNNNNFDFSTSYSISFWINPLTVSGGWYSIISKDHWHASTGFITYIANGVLTHMKAGGSQQISANISANIWTHITIVNNNGSATLYKNGVAVTNSTLSIQNNSVSMLIGRRHENNGTGTTNQYEGGIDEVGIWNYPLDSSSVMTLFGGYNPIVPSFVWSNGGITESIIVSPQSTTTYTVTATDANGCTNTDAVDVTVNALPAVNPGSNQAICGGDTITLYGNGSVGSNINSNPSLSFNGSSDYITISDPNNSSVAPSSIVNSTNEISNWSVSLHIKRAAKNGNQTIIQSQDYNHRGWAIRMENNMFRVRIGNGSNWLDTENYGLNYTFSSGTLDTNWYHLVLVHTANNSLKLYVDGTLRITMDDQTTSNNYSTWIGQNGNIPINIGRHEVNWTDEYFQGNIDELSIWSNSLSQNEIQNLISCSPTGTENNLVGFWNLNSTSITDMSNNGNNGSVNGALSINNGPDMNCSNNNITYLWDNNVTNGTPFTPQSTTTYTVTATDANGCTNTDAVDVTVNALPTVDAGVDVAICDGGSVTLTASGNSIITPSTLITFTNWGGNEPNNSGGEDYAHFANSSGTWNDHRSTHSTYHVMEAESDLGTISGYTYLGTYGGHYYYKSNGTATWANSKITAENSGGYLAVFSDLNENNFVANLSGKAWIGLYQDNTDPTYSEPAGG